MKVEGAIPRTVVRREIRAVDKRSVANLSVDSPCRLDLDNLTVENRRKSFGVGRFLDKVSVRYQGSGARC